MAKQEPMKSREPKTDCILYSAEGASRYGGCRGLNELYCATELRECPFYKSRYEFYSDGRPRKG